MKISIHSCSKAISYFNPLSPGGLFMVQKTTIFSPMPIFNPFVSIGRYLTSKGKVKVRDICLNISFLT